MSKFSRFYRPLLITFGVVLVLVIISRPWTESSAYQVARHFVAEEADVSHYYAEVFHYVSPKQEGVVLDASIADLDGASKRKMPLHIREDRRLATIKHPYVALTFEVLRLALIFSFIPMVVSMLITYARLRKKEPNQPLQRNASTGSVLNFQSPARRG